MLYTELDKIPLDTFIDVFLGDTNKLIIEGDHTEKELSDQYDKLVTEYIEIIGGTSILAEIYKKSNLINLQIKIECMKAAQIMIKNKQWEEVVGMLSKFGYNLFPSDHDKIIKRVASILSTSKYMLEKAEKTENPDNSSKMDRNYFVRERIMVMSHFGMQIQKNIISAKEYAFMVKRMCEDIKSIKSSRRK